MDQNTNITFRGKQRKIYDSYIELNELNDTLSSNTSEIKTRSLPDLSTSFTNEELEYKKNIDKLQTELTSANAEIDALLEENNSLKKKIMDQKNQISLLKQMCTNSANRISCAISTNVQNCPTKTTTVLQEPCTPKSHYRHNISNAKNIQNIKYKNIQPKKLENAFNLNGELYTSNKSQQSDQKYKQIYILGTQQCKGLSSILIDSRKYTSYEKYNISSLIKPNASCDAVLSLDFAFTQKDKLVVCIGENDSNPTKILLNLSTFIKKYKNISIFILGVRHNLHLNETKLNQQLKLICNFYSNCKFIDIKQNPNIYTRWSEFLFNTAKQINLAIDTIDYEDKYIKRNIKINKKTNSFTRFENKQDLYKKGTIPYYFLKTKLANLENPSIKKSKIKKTMLDYYPKTKQLNNNKQPPDTFFRN